MKKLLITLLLLIICSSAAIGQWDDQDCPKLISPVSVAYDATNNQYIMAQSVFDEPVSSIVWTYCFGIYNWTDNDSISLLTKPMKVQDIIIVNDTVFYTDGRYFVEMPLSSAQDTSYYKVNGMNEGSLRGLAYDNNRNIYFSQKIRDVIWKFNIDSKNLSNLILTGDALRNPSGIEFDQANNRLISVSNDVNGVIQEIDLDSMKVTTLVNTEEDFLYGITRDGSGNYYISSWGDGQNGSGKIIRYDSTFRNYTIISTGHSQPAHIFYNTAVDTLVIPERGADSLTFIEIVFPPNIPELAYPENEADGIETNLELRWQTGRRPDDYSIQIAADSEFNDIVFEDGSVERNAAAVDSLEKSQQYYWRVRAWNSLGTSEWSSVWSFTTTSTEVLVPELDSASQNNTPVPLKPVFSWSDTGADYYILQIAEAVGNSVDKDGKNENIILGGGDDFFPDPEIEISNIIGNTYTLLTSLKSGMNYYWRVKGVKDGMRSPWADFLEFTTDNTTDIFPETIDYAKDGSIRIYPNPVSSDAVIAFDLDKSGKVQLTIYDARGILVEELFNGYLPAGQNDLNRNFTNYGSGVFYLKLIAGTENKVGKLMLVR